LFLPLVTERSKYFLPWYITWSGVFIPLVAAALLQSKKRVERHLCKVWIVGILLFTFSGLFRYLPYLYTGSYERWVTYLQIDILWLPSIVAISWLLIQLFISRKTDA